MVAGVLLAFAAGLLFAAGNLAQKKAVDGLRRFSGRTPLATLTAVGGSWIWIAGAVLSVLGVLVQLDAYRHISIAEVQAIGGAGLAVLLVLPHVAFGERLTRREIVGAALGLVAFGLVVASMTSQGAPRARLLVPRTEIAIGAIVVVTVVLIAVFTHRDRASGAVFGLSAGLLYGAMGLGVRGASAAFTSSTLLHGVARLLAGPIPYSVALSWVGGLLVFQIGIQRSRLSLVAPISGVVSAIVVIAVGTPLFGESWPHSPYQFTLRLVGVLAILVALGFVLGPGKEDATTRIHRRNRPSVRADEPARSHDSHRQAPC